MPHTISASSSAGKRLSDWPVDGTLQSTACPGQAVSGSLMAQRVKKVLLVEDSDDYALLMTRGLHRSNEFQLLWRAKDGVEAVKFVGGAGEFSNREKFPFPDVMLLDLYMPRKDGWEVLEWIKNQPNRPIVVVLTILENAAYKKKALAMGADEFQVKPYTEEGLQSFLNWLSGFCDSRQQVMRAHSSEPKHATGK